MQLYLAAWHRTLKKVEFEPVYFDFGPTAADILAADEVRDLSSLKQTTLKVKLLDARDPTVESVEITTSGAKQQNKANFLL